MKLIFSYLTFQNADKNLHDQNVQTVLQSYDLISSGLQDCIQSNGAKRYAVPVKHLRENNKKIKQQLKSQQAEQLW